MRAPRECLRFKFAQPSSSRERCNGHDLDRPDRPEYTPAFWTHTLAAVRLFTCQRALLIGALQQSASDHFRHPRRVSNHCTDCTSDRLGRSFSSLSPERGGESYRLFPVCQRAVQIFFSFGFLVVTKPLKHTKVSTTRRRKIPSGRLLQHGRRHPDQPTERSVKVANCNKRRQPNVGLNQAWALPQSLDGNNPITSPQFIHRGTHTDGELKTSDQGRDYVTSPRACQA